MQLSTLFMTLENEHSDDLEVHRQRITQLGRSDTRPEDAATALVQTIHKWSHSGPAVISGDELQNTYHDLAIHLPNGTDVRAQNLITRSDGTVERGRVLVMQKPISKSGVRERLRIQPDGKGALQVHELKGRGRDVEPDANASVQQLLDAASTYPEAQLALDKAHAAAAEEGNNKHIEPGRRKMRREIARALDDN